MRKIKSSEIFFYLISIKALYSTHNVFLLQYIQFDSVYNIPNIYEYCTPMPRQHQT